MESTNNNKNSNESSLKPLPSKLYDSLCQIERCPDGSYISSYPCSIILKSKKVYPRVMVVVMSDDEIAAYRNSFKNRISIVSEFVAPMPRCPLDNMPFEVDAITAIKNSPDRLPKHITEQIYLAGETRMGYYLFSLEFLDRTKTAYVSTSGRVDFLEIPNGYLFDDIINVHPHTDSTFHGKTLGCIQYIVKRNPIF